MEFKFANVVYGVPITNEEKDLLIEKFGHEAASYMWFQNEDCILGFSLAYSTCPINSTSRAEPLKFEIPFDEQIKLIDMLMAIGKKGTDWRAYLLLY